MQLGSLSYLLKFVLNMRKRCLASCIMQALSSVVTQALICLLAYFLCARKDKCCKDLRDDNNHRYLTSNRTSHFDRSNSSPIAIQKLSRVTAYPCSEFISKGPIKADQSSAHSAFLTSPSAPEDHRRTSRFALAFRSSCLPFAPNASRPYSTSTEHAKSPLLYKTTSLSARAALAALVGLSLAS